MTAPTTNAVTEAAGTSGMLPEKALRLGMLAEKALRLGKMPTPKPSSQAIQPAGLKPARGPGHFRPACSSTSTTA